MKFQNIQDSFDRFDDLTVLVIGDVMIDSYIWGEVNRISPEAPVPILTAINKENRLGGAANVALNLQALGANPVICSVVGDGQHGDMFESLLHEHHISYDGVVRDPSRPTPVKTRIISDNQQLIRIDEEEAAPISGDSELSLKQKIAYVLNQQKIDAVIFEDYDKGIITPSVIELCVDEANKRNVPVLVDPKEKHFHDYKNVTLFKPNYKEFVKGLNQHVAKDDFEALYQLGKQFQSDLHIRYLLITLAEQGMLYCDEHQSRHIPAMEKLDIADVSGAGDTVISTLAVGMASGMNVAEAAVVANVAGGLVCEKAGVVSVNKEELLRELQQDAYFDD